LTQLYNIHPGSTLGQISVNECTDLIAHEINLALSKTNGVKVVLENMSRQGNTVGGDFRGVI
jgi:deoxyribonuclease-4